MIWKHCIGSLECTHHSLKKICRAGPAVHKSVTCPVVLYPWLWLICLPVLHRHPWRTRRPEAEVWHRSDYRRAGGHALLRPAVWNGLYPQTPRLQVLSHQPHLPGLPMGYDRENLQAQTWTWGRGEGGRSAGGDRHCSSGGEWGIADVVLLL